MHVRCIAGYLMQCVSAFLRLLWSVWGRDQILQQQASGKWKQRGEKVRERLVFLMQWSLDRTLHPTSPAPQRLLRYQGTSSHLQDTLLHSVLSNQALFAAAALRLCLSFFISGIESFEGRYFHSWEYHNTEGLQGKRVVVIGIGNWRWYCCWNQ